MNRVMRHATKRGIVVVAGNPGADIRAGTLSQVLKQAGLTENTESEMGQTEYLVIVEKYGSGSYGAYVPELPGIGVAGETEDEVRALVAEAIRLYLDERGGTRTLPPNR